MLSVWDGGPAVKSLEQVGYSIDRPAHCPGCGRAGTLVRHGSRPRKAWWPKQVWAFVLTVVRFRCGRHPIDRSKFCGVTMTILPGCLYPYRRYPLEIVQEAVAARFVALLPWSRAALHVGVCQATLRDWCSHYSQAAQSWLVGLFHWWSHSPQFATLAAVERSEEHGLLSTAGLCMDLREQQQTGAGLDERQILQRLWEWGFERLNRMPLLSTRFPEGGPAPVRPRGRDPDP